jgi:hypothetical protein
MKNQNLTGLEDLSGLSSKEWLRGKKTAPAITKKLAFTPARDNRTLAGKFRRRTSKWILLPD